MILKDLLVIRVLNDFQKVNVISKDCLTADEFLKAAIDIKDKEWSRWKALHEVDGVEFAPGHRLTDLDYADDIALLASSFGDLQSMVSGVNEVAKSVG
ncbi:hypothetical protein SprV_1002843200 [Sparganum proliferum]